MTSSLTVASPLAGGPLLPLPLLHQARGARLAQEHLDTSTIQVTTLAIRHYLTIANKYSKIYTVNVDGEGNLYDTFATYLFIQNTI